MPNEDLNFAPQMVTPDPDALVQALENSGRFRRDTNLGSIFHRRKVSFREVCPRHSLHIVVDGHSVSAHVDEVSPLNCDGESPSHYSITRVVAHNLSGIRSDVARRVSGRQGQHQCTLQNLAVHLNDDAISDLLSEPGS
ncbi:MAG TPA: hypothetical protein VNA57_11840 [Acidimicrobiales bacterium]|nr:hypothetical protein [Acidimicrobiales bacterium]